MGEIIGNGRYRWAPGVGIHDYHNYLVPMNYPYHLRSDGKGGFERAAYLFVTGSIEPVIVALKCN